MPHPERPSQAMLPRMDFGLFYLMQRDEQWSERAVYDSGLEQMLAAESLGYSSVWIAEHHFNDYGLCPVPPVLAAFLAARTRALRLGMGVSLLPLHHPVDLAEQLAVLDVVSGGRLDVGIGRGGTLQDYQTFQSDREDSRARVEEGITLIQKSWSGEPFDFAATPAALHRGQQRGQRALGGASRAPHALLVLRPDRGAAAPASALPRGVARARAVGRRGGGAGAPGVGDARGARGALS